MLPMTQKININVRVYPTLCQFYEAVNVHDARLVAAMLVHGLSHILTFNTTEFARYSEITAVHPTAIP